MGNQIGQTRDRQIDCLAGVGARLAGASGILVEELWTMSNGYARCTRTGLEAIAGWIGSARVERIDEIRGELQIGVHWDVEVTDGEGPTRPRVSQAICSALPVSYCRDVPSDAWRPFASLVLEAAYEATLWAAVLNAARGASNVVLLTLLGGGAFGNDAEWIHGAIRRALKLAGGFALDVRLVTYHEPSAQTLALAGEFG